MRLAVMIPWSSPFIWTRFTEAAFNVRHPSGVDVKWILGKGFCPARRHTDAVEKALEWGADWMMFFGADQIPPPDLLERLYGRIMEGYPMVCAMVPSRGYFARNKDMKPFMPMAWRWSSLKKVDEKPRLYRGQELDPDMIEVVRPDGKMQVVHMIGSGCIMFHRDHILAVKRPWFQESIDPITYKRFSNMDTRFSSRLQEEGGSLLWCDTSIKIQHLTDMAIDDSFQDRFDDWMDPENKNTEPEIVQHKVNGK